MSVSPRIIASSYTAPVGLFGLMMTIALVRSVILRSTSARSGIQSDCSSHR